MTKQTKRGEEKRAMEVGDPPPVISVSATPPQAPGAGDEKQEAEDQEMDPIVEGRRVIARFLQSCTCYDMIKVSFCAGSN